MSEKQRKIEPIIREYLLEETTIKKINDPKLEFGFQYTFPPGNDPSGRPIGQSMAVFQPKNKDILIISLGTQISPPHVEALNALEESQRIQFFIELRKLLLAKNLMFRIEGQQFRYEISEQYFVDKRKVISKNKFYRLVRKVFSVAAYCQIVLNDYCSGKMSPDELSKAGGLSGTGFSLYS